MYWLSKKDKIFKTNNEIREEIGFSERELKTAKTALKNVGFIKVSREGLPAKTYYEIDWDEYEIASRQVRTKPSQQVVTKPYQQVMTKPSRLLMINLLRLLQRLLQRTPLTPQRGRASY